VCREDAGECDVPEYCDAAGACPANGFESPGTACGSSSDTVCDNPDTCDAAGACQANHELTSVVCGADAGECDVPEYCAADGTCPANSYEPSGTPCGDPSDTVCDNPDTCNASGVCQPNLEPVTTVCRPTAGVCDVAEYCDGAGACPADVLVPATTECRPAAFDCDVTETCTGTDAACPPDYNECEAICRTPGFWGTHPIETQAVLDVSTGISVCGVTVQQYDDCAVEALCNTPRGDKKSILARQLLATALNCYLSNGDASCVLTDPDLAAVLATCNTACASGNNSKNQLTECSRQLDCYNNGGLWVEAENKCAIGMCSLSFAYCGGNYSGCQEPGEVCNPLPGNCHDKLLDGGFVQLTEPPNPADPGLCEPANSSRNTMFSAGVCP